MIYMKKARSRYIIISVVIIAILTLIAAVWYKNSIYPFSYAEKFYEENEEHINQIVAYFESFDDIYSAQMNIDGVAEIISNKGSENVNCSSKEGYKSLMLLREKYIKDSDKRNDKQSYMLNFIKAEYDDNGNMILEVPVYARVLNTDASVDTPNRIVYYLVYIDDNYSGDDTLYIKRDNAINDNWFVISESHTPG